VELQRQEQLARRAREEGRGERRRTDRA
jgi:hypothetical protein